MRLINPKDQILVGKIKTSRRELIDLIKAWAAISVAFAVLLGGSIFSLGFLSFFMMASLSVGLGFIAHEMSHKIVAQKYGCNAEFRSWDQMLVLAVVLSFFGLVIAAPGAVMITHPSNIRIGRRMNGKISAAGAVANLVVAALFLIIAFIPAAGGFLVIAKFGFMINTWLALFNMIPFWMFDGRKVLEWNKLFYFILIAVCITFLAMQGIFFP
jgi:Zn-dependent protease